MMDIDTIFKKFDFVSIFLVFENLKEPFKTEIQNKVKELLKSNATTKSIIEMAYNKED